MPKKKNIAEEKTISVTDGKLRASNFEKSVEEVRRLEKLIGMSRMNPYGTQDRRIFAEKLQEMTLAEKKDLAMRVGIIPENREKLLDQRLNSEFDSFVKGAGVNIPGPAKPVVDKDHPKYSEIKRLLSEGF